MDQWEGLYNCLRHYPDLFKEKDIGMNIFKYVYILCTNRAFSSNFQGITQMVPYADFINHENVDTGFDCLDEKGNSVGEQVDDKKPKNEEEDRQHAMEKRNFINTMKTELLELETKIRNKMAEEGHITQSDESKKD